MGVKREKKQEFVCRVGSKVKYVNCHKEIEYGVVTSINESFVFVRYEGDNNSKATHPKDLVLIM